MPEPKHSMSASDHLTQALVHLDHASAALTNSCVPESLRRPDGPLRRLADRVQRTFRAIEGIQADLHLVVKEERLPHPPPLSVIQRERIAKTFGPLVDRVASQHPGGGAGRPGAGEPRLRPAWAGGCVMGVKLYTRGRDLLEIRSAEFDETPRTYRRARSAHPQRDGYIVVRKDSLDTYTGRFPGEGWWTSEEALRHALINHAADSLRRSRSTAARYEDELRRMVEAWPAEAGALAYGALEGDGDA